MSSVDTLLTLMDHVDDVNQLEVLIEAKNLQRIMHAAGHDDAAMRRMIAAGETPGTMLLGVFKSGRTADEMMALIPAEDRVVQPAKSAPTTATAPARSQDHNRDSPSTSNSTVAGIVLLMGGAIVCATAVKIPVLGLTFLVYWQAVLGVVAVLGAIGGALLLDRGRAVGAVIGALASPIATYVTYLYIVWMASDMGRESLLIVEPVLVNMLAVALIFGVPMRLWSSREPQAG